MMTKKIISLVLAVLMAVMCFGFAGCGSEKAISAADTKKLIVGFDAEFPPYGFVAADGSYDGFDLALAQEVCSRLGWEYEAVAIDWDAKDSELASGTINCIWNGFTYTGRENEYTWSDVYVDNSIVAVVKADSGIASLADLAGKTVMVQKASSGSDALNANTELKNSLKETIELADYNTGFMELKQGTVDAVIVDVGVAKYNIGDETDSYTILSEAVSTEQYAVGFLLGDTASAEAVSTTLKEMADDGTMMEIAEKYEADGLELSSLTMCQ
jgi:polar amino acid transport system substrate-binding protein